MDTDLARTFLAVVEAGSFVEAAKRVFVTQSTVSMRIKTLEEQLGKPVFERSKAGATLTPAGRQFQKHASAMVRIWQQARLEVALPHGYETALTIGGQYSLWDGFLLNWLSQMRTSAPSIAIRTQVSPPDALMQGLINGNLDFAVMYAPHNRPGFDVELLFEEELLLVSSEARPRRKPGKSYIYIDWGAEFRADHSLNFPNLSTPGLIMELGSLGLQYLLTNQAAGYIPRRLAAPHLETGALKLVPRAPVFHYPAYVIHPLDGDLSLRNPVLKALRRAASKHRKI